VVLLEPDVNKLESVEQAGLGVLTLVAEQRTLPSGGRDPFSPLIICVAADRWFSPEDHAKLRRKTRNSNLWTKTK
jgi:hypothetical protein